MSSCNLKLLSPDGHLDFPTTFLRSTFALVHYFPPLPFLLAPSFATLATFKSHTRSFLELPVQQMSSPPFSPNSSSGYNSDSANLRAHPYAMPAVSSTTVYDVKAAALLSSPPMSGLHVDELSRPANAWVAFRCAVVLWINGVTGLIRSPLLVSGSESLSPRLLGQ